MSSNGEPALAFVLVAGVPRNGFRKLMLNALSSLRCNTYKQGRHVGGERQSGHRGKFAFGLYDSALRTPQLLHQWSYAQVDDTKFAYSWADWKLKTSLAVQYERIVQVLISKFQTRTRAVKQINVGNYWSRFTRGYAGAFDPGTLGTQKETNQNGAGGTCLNQEQIQKFSSKIVCSVQLIKAWTLKCSINDSAAVPAYIAAEPAPKTDGDRSELFGQAPNQEDRDEPKCSTGEGITGTTAQTPEKIGRRMIIDRKDHLRILQQALRKLGYNSVAQRLEDESVSCCLSFYSIQWQFLKAKSFYPTLILSSSI